MITRNVTEAANTSDRPRTSFAPTGGTVRTDATVKYKMRGDRYLEEKTACWTYSPGEKSCLDAKGCADHEDGLCKMASIEYVASIHLRRCALKKQGYSQSTA